MDILKECKDAKKIAISGHIRPDGDCVGSVMALYLYLQKALKNVQIDAILEKPTASFDCIHKVEEIKTEPDASTIYDVFFCLDCTKERLGIGEAFFDSAIKTINIDHHISNHGSGEFTCVVPTAGATCEVLFDLMDQRFMDREIAQAIYIGLIHDTGVFQYSNTTSHTLEIASKLIAYGFPFANIIEETFYQKTYIQKQIMSRAVLESILIMDGKCAVTCVDKKTMEFYHAGPKDLEGIINQLRAIQGVECAVFMYEIGLQEYKVSMRSTDKINVSEIAVFFGGGGHIKAAGCTMRGNFYDVINNLSYHIEKQLGQYNKANQ